MDSHSFVMQTCPYMVVSGECGHGHLHFLGGFVSDVPPGENEDPDDYLVSQETGEVLRIQSNIAYSLN